MASPNARLSDSYLESRLHHNSHAKRREVPVTHAVIGGTFPAPSIHKSI
jgi:hypothetical protein